MKKTKKKVYVLNVYLQAGVSAVGLFGLLPVLSSGAGRLWRRHEDPLLSVNKCHHGPAHKVGVCV